jgi:hypothetical protein
MINCRFIEITKKGYYMRETGQSSLTKFILIKKTS